MNLGARSLTHRIIRWLLTIWLVAYPVHACTPILIGASARGTGGGIAVFGGLMTGALLFWPWIVGIIVLGLLAVLTR